MKVAVGVLKMSTATFYMSEPREVELGLEGFRSNREQEFHLYEIAVRNAVGQFLAKNYKPVNPFEETGQKVATRTTTLDERNETLGYLIDKFSDASGVNQ